MGNRIARFLLRNYLKYNWKVDRKIVATLGESVFEGLHPRNVFNYGHDFFLQNVTSEDIVLDIGCGTGLILYKIAKRIKKGIGIDNSRKAIELCQKLHRSENLEFILSDIIGINYQELWASYSYNSAILSHILEHLKEPEDLILRINADKLLICVPSQENWFRQLLKHLELPYFSDRTHFREYTREMLENELHSVNYQVNHMGFNSEGEIVCKATKAQAKVLYHS